VRELGHVGLPTSKKRDASGIRTPELRRRGDRQKDSPEREARHRGDESGEQDADFAGVDFGANKPSFE
jgi:hypothetical protein